MPLTRMAAEAKLCNRFGKVLTLLGLDAVASGANAYLNDPLEEALRDLGYAVADPTNLTDSDLSALPVTRINQYLDLATINVGQSLLLGWDLCTQRAEASEVDLSDLRNGLEKTVARLADYYIQYTSASGRPRVGPITPLRPTLPGTTQAHP